MPMLPAICNNCGTKFSSGILVENVMNLTMKGNSVGPCPACGGMGRTKDGVFDVVSGVVKKLKDIDYTKEELIELSNTINKINENSKSDEFEEVIQKTNPKFAALLELLPKNREEKLNFIYFFVPILISLIGFIINISASAGVSIENNIDIQQIVNNIYENPEINFIQKVERDLKDHDIETLGKASGKIKSKNEPARSEKIGRNQPCICGSGLKYKKCHGN